MFCTTYSWLIGSYFGPHYSSFYFSLSFRKSAWISCIRWWWWSFIVSTFNRKLLWQCVWCAWWRPEHCLESHSCSVGLEFRTVVVANSIRPSFLAVGVLYELCSTMWTFHLNKPCTEPPIRYSNYTAWVSSYTWTERKELIVRRRFPSLSVKVLEKITIFLFILRT